MKRHLIIAFACLFSTANYLKAGSVTAPADLPAYYSSLDGKSGSALWSAVHEVSATGYSSSVSYNNVWSVYQTTDVYPAGHARAGKIWDMYGECSFIYQTNQCGNYSKECDCYNREHSIPKSWFGGSESANTPGSDVFHLVPTDGKVNGMRSNYAFGEVNSITWSYGNSRLGTPKSIVIDNTMLSASNYTATVSTDKVFEPRDEYKGDFARGYFGTLLHWAGSYQTFTTDDGAKMFSGTYTEAGHWGLTPYGLALLLKWHRQDPVSQKEIDRNNGIQKTQGNRNPFIDYPDLAEYIWGSHAGGTFSRSNATATFDSNYDPNNSGSNTTFTITLHRNGVITTLSDITGTYTLSLPQDEQDACDGWQFDGWASGQISNTTTTKPSYVTSANSDGHFYAVYKQTTAGGGTTTTTIDDELTLSTTGVEENSFDYVDWSNKTLNSTAVYKGQSAGGKSAIQLRSKNNNSGVITTTSGGKVKKITIVWNDGTDTGRTLNVYGKNSAYSAATDLYDNSKQGTLLGTIVKGTSTELSITDDYAYIGMRSNSGAMYLDKVTVRWETETQGGSTTIYATNPNCPEVKKTVTWDVDGNTDSESLVVGSLLVLPNDPEDCSNNKAFVGWTTDKNNPQNFITGSEEVYVTDDVTYYAVYAEETASGANVVTYEKQTSGTIGGQYLIVNEGSSVVFNGLSGTEKYETCTINNNTISYSTALEKCEVTIASMTEGYSIRINSSSDNNAGKYIYGTSGSNAMNFGNNATLNTISFDNENVNITSNTSVLRYNNATSNGKMFRYYKSSSYSSQQPIQLYKRTESSGEAIVTYYTSCSQSTTTAVEQTKPTRPTLVKSNGVVYSTAGDIYVYNVMGQMLYSTAQAVDISILSDGIYLVTNGKETMRIVVR